MTPLRAAVDPVVFWVLAIGFWVFGRVRDGLKRQSGTTGTPARRVPPPSAADARAADDARRGTQTTQQEAEELERWLRERLGLPTPKRELPPVIQKPKPEPKPRPKAPRDPLPAPVAKRSQAGPLGRKATAPLESHPEIEERESRSWNSEREIVDYDDQFPERAAPEILDLDRESAFAAERRKQQAERRNAAHTDEDHDAFHRRISSPEMHESEQKTRRARRLAALRASWITTEILGPPVSERRTS